jgi:hypothetical protein
MALIKEEINFAILKQVTKYEWRLFRSTTKKEGKN